MARLSGSLLLPQGAAGSWKRRAGGRPATLVGATTILPTGLTKAHVLSTPSPEEHDLRLLRKALLPGRY
jgi:hypothetical protein